MGTDMTSQRILFLSLVLPCVFGVTACSTRKVEVSMSGRRLDSLKARAEKTQGVWTMDMELPVGRWSVKLLDDPIAVRTLDQEGRIHARFDLPDGRIHDDKPLRLALQALTAEGAPEGAVYVYELQTRIPGQGVIEFFWRGMNNQHFR